MKFDFEFIADISTEVRVQNQQTGMERESWMNKSTNAQMDR